MSRRSGPSPEVPREEPKRVATEVWLQAGRRMEEAVGDSEAGLTLLFMSVPLLSPNQRRDPASTRLVSDQRISKRLTQIPAQTSSFQEATRSCPPFG